MSLLATEGTEITEIPRGGVTSFAPPGLWGMVVSECIGGS